MACDEQACVELLCNETGSPVNEEDAAQGFIRGISSKARVLNPGSRRAPLSIAAGLVLLVVAAIAAMAMRSFRVSPKRVEAESQQFQEFIGLNEAKDGRKPITFYVYRAGSKTAYPMENVNAADLAGVMWYLHNEVVVSTPRKYSIDRIRRYKVTLKNTQEFWNVHHRNFGAFLAFDAARCTTPICGSIFSQYGFIVGCQVLPIDVAPYLGTAMTQVNGACKGEDCNAPVWYSLPGPCPTEGLSNQQILGNSGTQDVMKAKGDTCLKEQPGGRCDSATGAPDCTFSYEAAGEIMLDELVGIKDYDYFWNSSFTDCERKVNAGIGHGPCRHNKEFDVDADEGVGCHFWDGKADKDKARGRMKAVRDLFKKHYPDMEYDLKEPACDFDMYYDGESDWPINHTGATKPSRGFSWEKAQDLKKTTTTPAPRPGSPEAAAAAAEPATCKELGCGGRRTTCACNSACKQYNDCCKDYEDHCAAKDDAESDGEAESFPKETSEITIDDAPRHQTSSQTLAHSEVSAACLEAERACRKATSWAKESGVFEHPEWYKGLTPTSSKEEFRKSLEQTGHGSCDKVCVDENTMEFRKLALRG